MLNKPVLNANVTDNPVKIIGVAALIENIRFLGVPAIPVSNLSYASKGLIPIMASITPPIKKPKTTEKIIYRNVSFHI